MEHNIAIFRSMINPDLEHSIDPTCSEHKVTFRQANHVVVVGQCLFNGREFDYEVELYRSADGNWTFLSTLDGNVPLSGLFDILLKYTTGDERFFSYRENRHVGCYLVPLISDAINRRLAESPKIEEIRIDAHADFLKQKFVKLSSNISRLRNDLKTCQRKSRKLLKEITGTENGTKPIPNCYPRTDLREE